jgi:SP family sugar:H+ symporter-like MFS transporter
MEINTLTGMFAANAITYFHKDWRFGMMLPGYAGAFVAIAVWLVPESPRYLFQAQGYNAAVAALKKVRSGDVQHEATEIRLQVEREHDNGHLSYSQLLRNPNLRRRVVVACGLNIAQQTTGVNVFNDYGARFFKSVGLNDPFLANVVFSGAGWLGIFTSLFLIDSRCGGRRILLLLGSVLLAALLFASSCASVFEWSPLLSLVVVCLYNYCNELTLQPIPWFYPSEIFTLAERDRATSLAVASQYVSQILIVQLGPYLIDWSKAGMCFLFGVMNVVNFAFIYARVKETKGVPLEKVPALFKEASDDDICAHLSWETRGV